MTGDEARREQCVRQFAYYLTLTKPGHWREPVKIEQTVMLDPIKGWRFAQGVKP